MKTKTILIGIVYAILLISGCTVEKRLFQPGYNIEWKKKKVSEKDAVESTIHMTKSQQPTELLVETTLESNVMPETEKPNPELITEPELPESMSEPITPSKTLAAVGPVENKYHKTTSPVHPKSVKEAWETEERKEFELFGVMSFGLYFSSMTLAIVGIVLLTSPYFFVAAGFMILLALIFGIISVDKYRRDRSGYRLNFFGYFGMIASMATITFVIGLLLLAWGLGSF